MTRHSLPSRLFVPSSGPAVKICGLTRPEDVELCLELDVDLVGFIFAGTSPRRVTPASVAAMPVGRAARVGVFAGQSVAEVLSIMEEARLDFAQLHGGEDETFCQAVGPDRVIKVLWPERLASEPGQAGDALRRESGRFAPVCCALVLDSGTGGGGSGLEQPRRILREFESPRPWLLAGGLGPDNINRALEECRPPRRGSEFRSRTAAGLET